MPFFTLRLLLDSLVTAASWCLPFRPSRPPSQLPLASKLPAPVPRDSYFRTVRFRHNTVDRIRHRCLAATALAVLALSTAIGYPPGFGSLGRFRADDDPAQEFRCHRGVLTIRRFPRADWRWFPTFPSYLSFSSGGFLELQVVQSGHFADLAEKNRVRSIPIIAPRGTMLDREGRVLVDSYPSFSILLLRDDPNPLDKNIPLIVDGLGISKRRSCCSPRRRQERAKISARVIKPAASEADIAFVESHRADIPLLELLMVQRRRYPHGEMLANTIGYVGEVSPQQLDSSDGHYRPGDIVGKAGLEREYNETLEGTDGMRRVVVNSVGKAMRTLDNVEAIPGKPIQLTIDYDLQAIAEANMKDKEGAVVAMDARTGEILAMVSRPTFDPNDFAVRIPARKNGPSSIPIKKRRCSTAPFRASLRRFGLQNCDGHRDAGFKGRPRRTTPFIAPATPISTDGRFIAGATGTRHC